MIRYRGQYQIGGKNARGRIDWSGWLRVGVVGLVAIVAGVQIFTGSAWQQASFELRGTEAAGPGGFTPSHWWRADSGVYSDAGCSVPATNGEDILCWDDTVGTNDMVPTDVVGDNPPSYVEDAFNNFPGIYFDELNFENLEMPQNPFPVGFSTTEYAMFMAVAPMDASPQVPSLPILLGTEPTTNARLYLYESDANLQLGIGNVSYAAAKSPANSVSNGIPRVNVITRNGNANSNFNVYQNAQKIFVNGLTGSLQHSESPYRIGWGNTTGMLTGYVLEYAFFEGIQITEEVRRGIETYFALKYGFTLTNDNDKDGTSFEATEGDYYLGSPAVIIWDADLVSTTYYNDIAGIINDQTDSTLLLTTAKSQNSDAIITIHSPSNLGNKEALLWANNNGATTWTATGAPSGYEILSRKWLFQETGDVGTFSVDIDVTDSDFDIPDKVSSYYYFVYDTDGDQDLSDETPVAMTSQGGGIWRASGVGASLDGAAVFSIAQYIDGPRLDYSATTLTESSQNDGTFDSTITIDLVDDSFTVTSGTFTSGTHYSVNNVPTGLTAVLTAIDSNTATLGFSGTAVNSTVLDDVGTLSLTFLDDAFEIHSASSILNYSVSDIYIDFIDVKLTYSTDTFEEADNNNGTIKNTIEITLGGAGSTETFTADVVSGGYVGAVNLPAGLSAVFSRGSDTQVSMALTGTATSHAIDDNVYNIAVTFTADAFTNITDETKVTNYLKNNVQVAFRNTAVGPTITSSGSFPGGIQNSPYAQYFSNSSAGTDDAESNNISDTGGGAASTTTQVDFIISLVQLFEIVNSLDLPPEISAFLTPLLVEHLYDSVIGDGVDFDQVPLGDIARLTPATFVGVKTTDLVDPDGICLPITFATMRRGDAGTHVMRLQRHLWQLGYGITPDGVYGESTADAVKFFQLEFGLEPDGIVGAQTITALEVANCPGPVTRTALFNTYTDMEQGKIFCDFQAGLGPLRGGESVGLVVRTIQEYLSDLGFFSGSTDGKYGSATEDAVAAFQVFRGITPDGHVGTETYAALTDQCPFVEVIEIEEPSDAASETEEDIDKVAGDEV